MGSRLQAFFFALDTRGNNFEFAVTLLRGPTAAVDYQEVPIQQRTLHDEVAMRIRDMIVEGRLDPGSRINEVQLGKSLGVSRTPLREALKTLASEGLVDLVRNKGAIIRKFALVETIDMMRALGAIEQTCARMACEIASDQEIAHFRATHDEMVADYEARNRLAYFKLNQQLHQLLVDMSHNETLARFHRTVQERLRRVRFIGNDKPKIWTEAVRQHTEITAALEARDKERLHLVLERHLDLTLSRLQEVSQESEL